MNRALVPETVGSDSIPGRVKPYFIKTVIDSSFFDVYRNGQCEVSTVCDRQVGRWRLDLEDRKGPFAVFWPR